MKTYATNYSWGLNIVVLLPSFIMLAVVYCYYGSETAALAGLREYRLSHAGMTRFMDFYTHFVSVFFYAAYIILLMVGLKQNRSDWRSLFFFFLITLCLSLLVTRVLKVVVGRPRPFYDDPFSPFSFKSRHHSFPSNHTIEMLYLTMPFLQHYRTCFLALVFGIFNALSGFARMYLGRHFPSDVLAALIFGSICCYIAWRVTRRYFPSYAGVPVAR